MKYLISSLDGIRDQRLRKHSRQLQLQAQLGHKVKKTSRRRASGGGDVLQQQEPGY